MKTPLPKPCTLNTYNMEFLASYLLCGCYHFLHMKVGNLGDLDLAFVLEKGSNNLSASACNLLLR